MRKAALLLLALPIVVGCGRKERNLILQNTEQIKAEQQRQAELLDQVRQQEQTNDERILANQQTAATNDQELLRIGNLQLENHGSLYRLAAETSSDVKSGNRRLDEVYHNLYGVAMDLNAAVGETRIVVPVNNDSPLLGFSDIPSGEQKDVIARMPIGSAIFQAKELTPSWSKGVIIDSNTTKSVVFASKYTKPLREFAAGINLELETPAETEGKVGAKTEPQEQSEAADTSAAAGAAGSSSTPATKDKESSAGSKR